MNDYVLKAGYDEQKLRIERLQDWIVQAISRPAMPRELRLEGRELVEGQHPEVYQAVERICPTQTVSRELSLEVER